MIEWDYTLGNQSAGVNISFHTRRRFFNQLMNAQQRHDNAAFPSTGGVRPRLRSTRSEHLHFYYDKATCPEGGWDVLKQQGIRGGSDIKERRL